MGKGKTTKLDTTLPGATMPVIERPDRHQAETVASEDICDSPGAGINHIKLWQELLDGNEQPSGVILVADSISCRANSVISYQDGDPTRIDLIFSALNQHYDLIKSGKGGEQDLFANLERRSSIVENAIRNASMAELIKIGVYLNRNPHLFKSAKMLCCLMSAIFVRLDSFKKIEDISQEIALRSIEAGETDQ